MTTPQLFADPTPAPAAQRPARRRTPPRFVPPLTNLTRQTQCPDCRTVVLDALDARVLAFHVHLDPTNITEPHHELHLVLTGHRTYTAHPETPGRYRLTRRDSYEIVRTTAQRPIVLATHTCGTPVAGQPLPRPRRPAGAVRCPF